MANPMANTVELAVCNDPAALPPLPSISVPALYVHIPFCFHKCHYCDFYSITGQSEDRMRQFVDRLLLEADQWAESHGGPVIQPKTVFFGGGTPSLLPSDQMHRLISGLQSRFDFSSLNEWTIEINPATADFNYCRMLKSCGITRLSFGAQSFDRAELSMLERHHNPDDVPRSIELARAAGFHRLNLDLIFAIPGQSLESWAASLEAAIALQTPHLSCYALTYEPNTAMTRRLRAGEFIPAPEDRELAMLHHVRDRLQTAGMQAYEISNFAIPGEQCRHNLNYWKGGDYIGIGPSAASHVRGNRWKNPPHLSRWESAIDANILPATEIESLDPMQRAGELAMLMLRLNTGLVFDEFEAVVGLNPRQLFAQKFAHLQKLKMLDVSPTAATLTRRGIEVADAIAAEFLTI